MATECAVEIGDIAETVFVRDLGDVEMGVTPTTSMRRILDNRSASTNVENDKPFSSNNFLK